VKPWLHVDGVTVFHGDCIEVMRQLPDNSVDSVVTDPPYGLEFMGKEWDAPWKGKAAREFNQLEPGTLGGFTRLPNHSRVNNVKCDLCDRWKFSSNPCKCDRPQFPNARLAAMEQFQLWFTEVATEALRILKPGGHLLAFGGTRTWHRLAVAIEDAGFEIRDSIAWHYGSGFPKSLDVSKAIDKRAGAEREVVGTYKGASNIGLGSTNSYITTERGVATNVTITAPATPAAEQWQGWGTALKPAHEPIVVARKPLIGTVAENVLTHGTGALNIDGCRIGTEVITSSGQTGMNKRRYNHGARPADYGKGHAQPTEHAGRWPANVILDESQAAELDKQSGVTVSAATPRNNSAGKSVAHGKELPNTTFGHNDTGGASRFFYVAKASKKERPNVDGVAHPTVKPMALMRYLVRLVTPPGGTVLEPFAGSGTTIEACVIEGFNCIAIEREADYLPLIQARLNRPIQGAM
jgi:DNA modification methylase